MLPLWLSLNDANCCVLQSYRKTVAAARRDKKGGRAQGLTEEQKQEIRLVATSWLSIESCTLKRLLVAQMRRRISFGLLH